MPPIVPSRASWMHNLPAVLATAGAALVNLVVVVWYAATLNSQVAMLDRRLASMEIAMDRRSEQIGEATNRLARIEGRLDLNRKGMP